MGLPKTGFPLSRESHCSAALFRHARPSTSLRTGSGGHPGPTATAGKATEIRSNLPAAQSNTNGLLIRIMLPTPAAHPLLHCAGGDDLVENCLLAFTLALYTTQALDVL